MSVIVSLGNDDPRSRELRPGCTARIRIDSVRVTSFLCRLFTGAPELSSRTDKRLVECFRVGRCNGSLCRFHVKRVSQTQPR